MELYELVADDLKWLIPEVGEPVIYEYANGQQVETQALVDRNAETPPPYGYENTLSQKHHEFTFVGDTLPHAPKRGDLIKLGGVEYQIDFIHPNDEDIWIVAAR